MTRNSSSARTVLFLCIAALLAAPVIAYGQCGDVVITQSVDPALVEGLNTVGCFFPEGSTFNAYARCFEPAENFSSGGPFTIDCIHFGVEDLEDTNGDGAAFVLTVRLASYPAGCGAMAAFAAGGGGTTLYEGNVSFSANESYPQLTEHVLPNPITLATGTTLVAELIAPDAVDDSMFFVGSNTAGETGSSYYTAPDCDFDDYTPLADLGFPEVNIVLSLDGSPATTVACCLGNGACSNLTPAACTGQGGTAIGGSCTQDCDGNGQADGCELLAGAPDCNGNAVLDACECLSDLDGSGGVDPFDRHFAMFKFGCPVGTADAACDAADVNCDGVVDPLDANHIAARFGACP